MQAFEKYLTSKGSKRLEKVSALVSEIVTLLSNVSFPKGIKSEYQSKSKKKKKVKNVATVKKSTLLIHYDYDSNIN